MKDRKQKVIKMAHQLFIEKGFQATSIQDILDYSGIAKGTFYNYFSSKNELLIALIKSLYQQMETERDELLIGKDPTDIEVFIKQLELQLEFNRTNNLYTLFEEVMILNDNELKQFIRKSHLRVLRWAYGRFLSIFGEEKKPYLLDCAITFFGILNHNYKYNFVAEKSPSTLYRVVRYSVNRLVKIVDEVAESGEQLLRPELLDSWAPEGSNHKKAFQQELHNIILPLKKSLEHNSDARKYGELLDFIYDELVDEKEPRHFLVESALTSLKKEEIISKTDEFKRLEGFVIKA
ncbi:TetR/AcrR family transcriptional regulator [Robertmurraya sp. Marseille-Q9965]